jgi:hypothetical protein
MTYEKPHRRPRWRRRLLLNYSVVPLSLHALGSLHKVLLNAATLRAEKLLSAAKHSRIQWILRVLIVSKAIWRSVGKLS